MRMHFGLKLVLLALALSLTPIHKAHAGIRYDFPVTIYTPKDPSMYSYATGNMGAAHNSPDTTQEIGCSVGISQDNSITLNCFALDGQHFLGCTARGLSQASAPVVGMISGSLTSEANISFYVDSAGNCQSVTISVDSAYSPKSVTLDPIVKK